MKEEKTFTCTFTEEEMQHLSQMVLHAMRANDSEDFTFWLGVLGKMDPDVQACLDERAENSMTVDEYMRRQAEENARLGS
jgi:hypothetical protein